MTEHEGAPLWPAGEEFIAAELAAMPDEPSEFDPDKPWHSSNHPWMKASQMLYEEMREANPGAPEVDDPDPMIRVFAARNGGRIPPHKFWDTAEMWQQARQERMHPFTLWSIRSATTEESKDPEYITWVESEY